MGSRKRRKRRPLSPVSNRFALATITRITLGQRGLYHHFFSFFSFKILQYPSKRDSTKHKCTITIILAVISKHHKNNMNINVIYVTANLEEGEILGIALKWAWGHFEVQGGSQRASINVPHHHDPHQTSYSYALHPVNPQRHNTQTQNTKIQQRQFCLFSFGFERI